MRSYILKLHTASDYAACDPLKYSFRCH